MPLIILVGVSLTLFGAFLILTTVESRYGRVGGNLRLRLDRFAGRAEFVAKHVDWSALIKHLTRTGIERLLHDMVHGSLMVVRFLERTLTRFVRLLRERRSGVVHATRQRVSLRETLRKFRRSLTRERK